MSQQLSPAAEILRQEIKKLITEASSGKPKPGENATNFYEQDANGNRTYDGSLYERKVSLLMEAMELGKGWGWSLAYFSQPRPIINKFKRMWLVPLSENATITPAEAPSTEQYKALTEGYRTFVGDQPILNSPSTVIFVAPM
ncbi:unnamed protein product [Penicillium viridicatum]